MWRVLLTILAVVLIAFGAFVGWVVYQNRPLPLTVQDAAILERTQELLADASVWSKEDTRECPAGQPRLSLYCALRQASEEITGGFEHRAAALQEVRYAIDRAQPDADYAHRLMDYNNSPDVSLEDVQAMLREALDRIHAREASEL